MIRVEGGRGSLLVVDRSNVGFGFGISTLLESSLEGLFDDEPLGFVDIQPPTELIIRQQTMISIKIHKMGSS